MLGQRHNLARKDTRDPSDQIYMEVELRRLTWLNHTLTKLGNAIPVLMGDDLLPGYVSSRPSLRTCEVGEGSQYNVLVALPYNSDIPRAIWNPPLILRGRPQPKYAARVGVSDFDMPHDTRPA
ncbi:hypothetical protein CQW23_06777 [Capsicum baccatum]|uniref:NPK1-activating kinesin-like protein C-terminal domain-containing protein n=1 Tax=Capsicum baccatum TaxID=33114 RepID=A0A2G2X498_CAPBA|nr:hypothetical protein CQW23_06777 [Capsicum baccatum]